jgi:hypothetical protein
MEGTALYNVWAGMIQRCENPKGKAFHRYGGCGIKVCPEWRNSFEAFYRDMGPKPPHASIDRLDNDGNYEPGNCEWSTPKRQSRNRSTSKMIEYRGVIRSGAEWAEIKGFHRKLVVNRLSAGWSVEDALTKPLRISRKRNKRK